MDYYIELLRVYLRMTWRFRWIVLVIAGLGCVVGWVGVLMMPNQYEVKAKAYLDTSTLLKPVLKGLAVDNNVQLDSARLVRRTLLVRPNLESIARKTDLDLRAETPEQFEALLNGLAKQIEVSGTERDNIYQISYAAADPELANKVVESVLNLFVERSLGESRKDTSTTRQFIERQIAEYASRLDAAEERLKEFKQRNVGMMPGEGGDYYARREDARAVLAQAELELREAEQRAAALAGQLEGEEPVFGVTDTSFQPRRVASVHRSTPFDSRIGELEESLDQLLLQFTDRHPDVKSTRSLLESIKSQRDEYIESTPAPVQELPSAGGPMPVNENPVFQELKLAHGQAMADVAGLTERVTEYQRRVAKLDEAVDTIPRIEAELARLDRDYDVNRRNYDELVKRRESLKLAEEAGQTTDSVKFNIIDPPRVPLLPTGPDRTLLSSAVLIGVLGASIALGVLLGLLRPAVYSRNDLSSITDRPVLGVVSRLWTPRERLRRRMEVASFAVGCLSLVGAYGVLLGLFAMDVGLPEKVQRLAERIV